MARNTRRESFLVRYRTSQRSRQSRRTSGQPYRRRLRIEPLEERRLLALVTVNTLGDSVNFNDGVTSLREAIFATNLVGGADTIDFAPSLTSGGPTTITLTQGELKITDSLAINGPGANLLTIDASRSDPTPNENNGDGSRVFNVDDGTSTLRTVAISGLTLTGGDANGAGGAIFAGENLTVADSIVTGNATFSMVGYPGGGGIYSKSPSGFANSLTVLNSSIIGNAAVNSEGGGIRKRSGRLIIDGSTIGGNTARTEGGGVSAADGNVNVQILGSTISGNSAGLNGGGVFLYRASATITGSTISGNLATYSGGGGIFKLGSGSMTVTNSAISGNSAGSEGGGIHQVSGVVTVTASTISDNVAMYGGAIFSRGVFNVGDSVISGNSAGSEGGGIHQVSGVVMVSASTISNNVAIYGGGIFTRGDLTVSDSTIIGNSAGSEGGGLCQASGVVMVSASTISDNSANSAGGAIFSRDDVTVSDSTISGNSAGLHGGGIFSRDGRLTVTESTISGNIAGSTELYGVGYGGGIFLNGNSNARLTVILSTISGNSAGRGGGGIYGRNITVTGSTISGNSAARGRGGGIVARYDLSVTSSTISSNSAVDGGGIWTISAAMTVTGSTISGNSATNRGGGIYGGYTTVTGSTISGNSAGREGGGIVARYNLSVTSSTISGNSAGREGGGISRITFGNTTVTDSTISGNSASNDGGGISGLSFVSSTDTLTVTNSTISGNSSGRDGGGIWKSTLGVLTVTESTISDNSAVRDGGGIMGGGTITTSSISGNAAGGSGGGISHGSGTLTVTASSIQRNTASLGAGIFNASGNATVTESTIRANSASGNGGAVFARGAGSVTVVNSTISGNSSTGSAGGLYLFGTGSAAFTLRHSTIAFNKTSGVGGGVFLVAGPLSLDHAILATNTALLGPDVTTMGGSVLSARYSLIGTSAGSSLVEAPVGAPDANGNLIGGPGNAAINPLLGPLMDNGGPTLTHAFFVGSPAHDAGDVSALSGVGTVPAVDQRGAPFVRVFGGRIDIGAYERQSVSGLELIVSTLADVSNGNYFPGDLSLREAIGLANGSVPSLETITFAAELTASGPKTIHLTLGELRILDSLAINGPGASLLTIDASGNDPTPNLNNGDGSRVFNIDDGLVFPIPQQVQNVAISGLTLTGGDVVGNGGAIRNRESLTVTDSTISGNSAIGSGIGYSSAIRGGGIYSSGNLSVARSTISGNSVTGRGGGIWSYGGFTNTLTVTDSTFNGNSAGNTGGGIESAGTTRVTNSTFSGNSAGYGYGGGGGIRSATGALTVTGSTISGNSARSGSGGGISGSAGSNLTVTDSTISGNSAGSKGGGIYGFFETVTNSTISGNTAGGAGGGIYSQMGILTVTSSTISGNSAVFDGGGIRAAAERRYGHAVFSHTIVAGNTQGVPQTPNDAIGGVTMSFSLLGVDTGATITNSGGNLIGTAAVPIDPHLGPLADNGGPTQTRTLLTGSPAINAGDPSAIAGVGGVPVFDQRGALFGRVANGRIDIGAFEVQPAPALLGDYNFNGVVDAADFTVWRSAMGQAGIAPYSGADGSGNGSIGMEDYAVWKSHFGDVLPGTGGGASSSATLAAPVASAAEPGTPHARVRGSESVYDRYFSPIATGLPGLRRVGAPHAMSDFVNGTARPNENLLLALLSATTARPIGGEAIDEFVAHDTAHEPLDGHFAAVDRVFELLSPATPPK